MNIFIKNIYNEEMKKLKFLKGDENRIKGLEKRKISLLKVLKHYMILNYIFHIINFEKN